MIIINIIIIVIIIMIFIIIIIIIVLLLSCISNWWHHSHMHIPNMATIHWLLMPVTEDVLLVYRVPGMYA